ncbi:hypothetical protein TNCV_2384981 [Trichonephila clavipes]|nr:hypothetical protein TNCV_2384981 [Trichonephila clavipes]
MKSLKYLLIRGCSWKELGTPSYASMLMAQHSIPMYSLCRFASGMRMDFDPKFVKSVTLYKNRTLTCKKRKYNRVYIHLLRIIIVIKTTEINFLLEQMKVPLFTAKIITIIAESHYSLCSIWMQSKLNLTIPPIRIVSAYARNTLENNRKFPVKDFHKILNSGKTIIIAGDLNATHHAWNNARSNAFGYALCKIVNKPNVRIVAPHTPTVANVVPTPFDYVGDQKRIVLLPEEVWGRVSFRLEAEGINVL